MSDRPSLSLHRKVKVSHIFKADNEFDKFATYMGAKFSDCLLVNRKENPEPPTPEPKSSSFQQKIA